MINYEFYHSSVAVTHRGGEIIYWSCDVIKGQKVFPLSLTNRGENHAHTL